MVKETKKNNSGIIVGICCAVVLVVAIVLAVVLANQNQLGDAYFKSDGTKYVLTFDADEMTSDDEAEYTPVKTHIVYTYKDDTVTGLKTYAEYADSATAKKAYDALKEGGTDLTNIELNGKYIIETATAEQYEGLTASDVKRQIDFYESLKNGSLNQDDTSEEPEASEGETVETEVTNDGTQQDEVIE